MHEKIKISNDKKTFLKANIEYSSGNEDPLGAFQVDFHILTNADKKKRVKWLWRRDFYNAFGA